jgi:microcystin-dependent protein
MSFQQTSAPTGWTKDTSTANLNDSLMTITTGSVTSGGTTGFVSWNSSGTTGATTLSSSQIPSHSHTITTANGQYGGLSGNLITNINTGQSQSTVSTNNTGGGGSHTHPVSSNIKYFSFIIAVKN